ncbi:MAG: DUF615 domain-containing protein [Myxococcales bacterium]|nr:DUF615 domain-containing protein [Myxococcales bacterium]
MSDIEKKGREKVIDWSRDVEAGDSPSERRSARRKAGRDQADEATVLADILMELNDLALTQVPMPDHIASLLKTTRAMRHDNAQRRTIRLLTSELRGVERGPMLAAVDRLRLGKGVTDEAFHDLERQRDRLLNEGESALEEVIARAPGSDRQRLRNLVRQARKEATEGKPPKAARELFRALRDLAP